LKYVIVKDGAVKFGPSLFNKSLFNGFLKREGINVALSKPEFVGGGYEILETTDNLSGLLPWQKLGKPTFVLHSTYVEIIYGITTRPAEDLIVDKVTEIYNKCQALLDAQVVGRSVVEINRWESLKGDVLTYAETGVVSTLLENVVATSVYSADQMVMYVKVRSDYEELVFANRYALVSRVSILTDHGTVNAFDVEAGWPLGVQ